MCIKKIMEINEIPAKFEPILPHGPKLIKNSC